jgi:hypothetical protein
VPVSGGSVDDLRPLVNVPDDDAWHLFVAWLVAALRPGRPFPVLVVNGEPGAAKSTLCKFARALIDPSRAPLRRPPRDERDLAIAAGNSWVVGYDNLSGIPPYLSDGLCSLATGGGFSTRELYTDADEWIFDGTRPVLLNGIEDLATRSDLLDRSLTLTLPTIPDERRRDEEGLLQDFEAVRPRVLGALLDAVSAALRNRAGVRLREKPRMADFACWVVAAEPSLGWPDGAFIDAYLGNRNAANELALESSPAAAMVLAFMAHHELWEGTLAELLAALDKMADDKTKKLRDWPTKPRALSGQLRRVAPNLRAAGLTVTFGPHRRTGSPVRLEQACKRRSPSPTVTRSSRPNPLRDKGNDGGDGGDGELQGRSGEGDSPPHGDAWEGD